MLLVLVDGLPANEVHDLLSSCPLSMVSDLISSGNSGSITSFQSNQVRFDCMIHVRPACYFLVLVLSFVVYVMSSFYFELSFVELLRSNGISNLLVGDTQLKCLISTLSHQSKNHQSSGCPEMSITSGTGLNYIHDPVLNVTTPPLGIPNFVAFRSLPLQ